MRDSLEIVSSAYDRTHGHNIGEHYMPAPALFSFLHQTYNTCTQPAKPEREGEKKTGTELTIIEPIPCKGGRIACSILGCVIRRAVACIMLWWLLNFINKSDGGEIYQLYGTHANCTCDHTRSYGVGRAVLFTRYSYPNTSRG